MGQALGLKVYVVVKNHLPDAAFDSEEAALAYCRVKNAERREHRLLMINWTIYEFPVRSE